MFLVGEETAVAQQESEYRLLPLDDLARLKEVKNIFEKYKKDVDCNVIFFGTREFNSGNIYWRILKWRGMENALRSREYVLRLLGSGSEFCLDTFFEQEERESEGEEEEEEEEEKEEEV